jgi:hypothetical protein
MTMIAWRRPLTMFLRRSLDNVQAELRALEQDLGLCAECAGSPPPPLRERRLPPPPLQARRALPRRVA